MLKQQTIISREWSQVISFIVRQILFTSSDDETLKGGETKSVVPVKSGKQRMASICFGIGASPGDTGFRATLIGANPSGLFCTRYDTTVLNTWYLVARIPAGEKTERSTHINYTSLERNTLRTNLAEFSDRGVHLFSHSVRQLDWMSFSQLPHSSATVDYRPDSLAYHPATTQLTHT